MSVKIDMKKYFLLFWFFVVLVAGFSSSFAATIEEECCRQELRGGLVDGEYVYFDEQGEPRQWESVCPFKESGFSFVLKDGK